MGIILVTIYSILSVLIYKILKNRIEKRAKLLLVGFWSFYLVTCVVGATLIGLSGEIDYGKEINSFIDAFTHSEFIYEENKFKYWTLLFAPFIIPPFLLWVLSDKSNINEVKIKKHKNSFIIILIAISFVLGYCLMKIFLTNNRDVLTLTAFFQSKGSFDEYLVGRNQAFKMGMLFFGILYHTLPIFTHIALFNYIKLKEKKWLYLILFLTVTIIWLSLGVNQKAPVVIFLIALMVGYTQLSKVKFSTIFFASVCGILIISSLQIFILGAEQWEFLGTLYHVFLRVPHPLPYYVNYYPSKLPFVGIDFGVLNLFLKVPYLANDNIDLYDVIWGSLNGNTLGTITAPLHFRAFAQGGFLYGLISTTYIPITIVILVNWLKRIKRKDEAIAHGIWSQSFIIFYYYSQTNIAECLFSSYGIIWLPLTYYLIRTVNSVIVFFK